MLDRRDFFFGSCLGAGFLLTRGCAANPPWETTGSAGIDRKSPFGEPAILGPDFTGPLPADIRPLGTRLPLDEQEQVATRIVERAPTSSPLAVMTYFASIAEVNRNGESLQCGMGQAMESRDRGVLLCNPRQTQWRHDSVVRCLPQLVP